jgi:hypothetical protein
LFIFFLPTRGSVPTLLQKIGAHVTPIGCLLFTTLLTIIIP